MPLSLDSRHCGQVYVIRCTGAIVTGDEATTLEAAITRGLREFQRLVLDLSEVTRVDSTGLGMLVRFLSHTRTRGGDIRLSAPQPFLVTLLKITKLATVFRVYDAEDEAIVSFLKEPQTSSPQAKSAGPMVLFVDQSADLCAFVRTVLHHNGYEVLSTCRVHDAKTLLRAARVDFIILGPDNSPLPSDSVAASLKALSPDASTVLLDDAFQTSDPDRATADLLQRLQTRAAQG